MQQKFVALFPPRAHNPLVLQGSDSKNAAQTVYTVRMSTGGSRGAGLSELCAGVWLGLVGQNGETFLHRAVPLCDSEVIERELFQICQVQPQLYRDTVLESLRAPFWL